VVEEKAGGGTRASKTPNSCFAARESRGRKQSWPAAGTRSPYRAPAGLVRRSVPGRMERWCARRVLQTRWSSSDVPEPLCHTARHIQSRNCLWHRNSPFALAFLACGNTTSAQGVHQYPETGIRFGTGSSRYRSHGDFSSMTKMNGARVRQAYDGAREYLFSHYCFILRPLLRAAREAFLPTSRQTRCGTNQACVRPFSRRNLFSHARTRAGIAPAHTRETCRRLCSKC